MDRELGRLWALVPGPQRPPEHRAVGPTVTAASAFDVGRAARLAVAAAVLGVAEVGQAAAEPPTINADHALAACSNHLRVDGRDAPMWGDLSGCYATADDRFVQIHANFPHHGAGVARRLGVPAERVALARAIATWTATELEAALIDDGMICAAYRSLEEWAAHPHAAATDGLPLIDVTPISAPATAAAPVERPPAQDRPLGGIRVLDCSRVLAGPVCGQTLAASGADVLRVGARHLPSVPAAVISTGFGKRNAFVDLRTASGRRSFRQLLEGADVLIDAYRPGALAGHGFSAEAVAGIRPGIVVVEISAFDWHGPWAGRRGYDSIVQSTTGLAVTGAELSGSTRPVHLPFPALDYATGFLATFAACRLLAHQRRVGGSWRARLSLLRTRNWLVSLAPPRPFTRAPLPDLSAWTHEIGSTFGRIEAPRPVIGRWDRPPAPLGSSPPVWLARPSNLS